MNRIHRIGQKAAIVRVRKFIVVDSVEEKIVNLQRKKKVRISSMLVCSLIGFYTILVSVTSSPKQGMANEILSDVDGEGQLESSKPNLEDFKLIFGR